MVKAEQHWYHSKHIKGVRKLPTTESTAEMNQEQYGSIGDSLRFVDHYVQAGTVKARYWAAGAHGTPILFIHGLGASVQIWRPALEVIGRKHRVLAVDLPGFGRSDKPDAPYTLEYMANFIRDFLDMIGVPRVTLVAHSFGGAVALRFALDFPERLERLVLVAPAALSHRASPLLLLMTLPGVGELLSFPNRAGTAMLFRHATYKRHSVSDAIIDESYELAKLPGAQRCFLIILRATGHLLGQRQGFLGPILSRLSEIAAPTLVLWGRQDRIVPEASMAAASIPGAHIEVWDECGHIPWIEHTDRFNIMLLNFLSK